MDHRINAARFAGSWYPARSDRLATLLATAASESAGIAESATGLDSATGVEYPAPGAPGAADTPGPADTPPRIAVLPHAGLLYSARGQMAFWRRRAGMFSPGSSRYDAIVILSPSHYVNLPADSTVGAAFTGHETTGGVLPGIPRCLGDEEDLSAVEREHAVELLFPAPVYQDVTIPLGAVLVAPMSGPESIRSAAGRIVERIRRAFDPDRVLWLVSSDFTHYGPRFGFEPLGRGSYGTLGGPVADADRRVAEAAASGDLERYLGSIAGGSTVCGRHAIALALAILEHTGKSAGGTVLSYYTSADIASRPAEERNFVCYATVEVFST